MNGRSGAGFSERVWVEIDQTMAAVKAANCTARRFLEIDGPYGLGLTSVAGAEGTIAPNPAGAPAAPWGVGPPAVAPPIGAAPLIQGPGTYLASSGARPLPVIAHQFNLGIRATTAYDAGCQPLDLSPAVTAARDVALEEERLIYYGSPSDPAPQALLRIDRVIRNYSNLRPAGNDVYDTLIDAINRLSARGYAGPFALVVEPDIYRRLYGPVIGLAGGGRITSPRVLIDLIRHLFRGGIYMAPVINASADPGVRGDMLNRDRVGAVVTLSRAYSRLVVAQDWYTDYRGCDGVLHNFVLLSSLQVRISDPRSIQVLRRRGASAGGPIIARPKPRTLTIRNPR